MKRNMVKIKLFMNYDYIRGHLRYGHKEGIVELTDEEYAKFKENPKAFIEDTDIDDELNFVLDDYEIDDVGNYKVGYKEVGNE